MRGRLFFAGLVAFGVQSHCLRAESWRTVHGDHWEGRLGGVYGHLAVIAEKNGTRSVPIELLDDPGVARVADYLLARPAAAPAWSAATSKVGKALRGRLQVLRNGKLVTFDPGSRPEPEIYLAYFGAEWCGPCKRFSPTLVSAYEQLKRAAGDRFELVFISSDRDSAEQLAYVRQVGMPWPVLKLSAVGSVEPIERWKGRGIPNLIAITPGGDVLLHSYRGEEYLGPEHVLEQFALLVSVMNGGTDASRRAMHRLSVLQHVRAAGGGALKVKPYVLTLDLARYQTLEVKQLTAHLEIDEQGRVADAKFEPAQSAVVDYQLVQDAGKWLFLPRVENGRALRAQVLLPLQL